MQTFSPQRLFTLAARAPDNGVLISCNLGMLIYDITLDSVLIKELQTTKS